MNHFVVYNILNFAHVVTYRVIDRGLLEVMGPKGVSEILIRLAQGISGFQSGMVFNYVLIVIVFMAVFICSFMLI